jgi:hypothetical protein
MSSEVTTVRGRRSMATAIAGVLLAIAVVLAGCSGDGSEDAEAPRRTTTTEADGAEPTTTTAADDTTTTGAPTTPTTPTTAAPGSSSSFRGAVDGQEGIQVAFTRSATALTDVRADGLELTCQPLEGGDAKTITVDVAMAQVPLGTADLVEHTESGAPYEPTLSGSFTPDGSFAGSLYLSGQADGFACGGEFTFIASPA